VVIIPQDKLVKPGDYIKVKINRATQATLFGDTIQSAELPKNSFALTA
jgi:hypothetical protein